MTTTFDETITSERPTDGSGLTKAVEPRDFPVLFWAAVILFVANLLVLFGIWISPDIRVGFYGQDEGLLAGSYAKPSPFMEKVKTVRRVARKPEKVRPIFYEEPEPVVAAEVFLPGANAWLAKPTMARHYEYELDSPRATDSAARIGHRVRHMGSVEIVPRSLSEQH